MKNQKGYLMLEALVMLAIVGVMLAVALPNAALMAKSLKEKTAKTRVIQMYQLEAALAVCDVEPGLPGCASAVAMAPTDGKSITDTAYSYKFSGNDDHTWSYTATPLYDNSLKTFSIDQTGALQ